MKAAANGNLGFFRIYMYMFYIAPNTKRYTLHRSGNLNSLFDHMAAGKILHGMLDLNPTFYILWMKRHIFVFIIN
jgi:hypothetical protein